MRYISCANLLRRNFCSRAALFCRSRPVVLPAVHRPQLNGNTGKSLLSCWRPVPRQFVASLRVSSSKSMLRAMDHRFSRPSSQPTTIHSMGRLPLGTLPCKHNVVSVFSTPMSILLVHRPCYSADSVDADQILLFGCLLGVQEVEGCVLLAEF